MSKVILVTGNKTGVARELDGLLAKEGDTVYLRVEKDSDAVCVYNFYKYIFVWYGLLNAHEFILSMGKRCKMTGSRLPGLNICA